MLISQCIFTNLQVVGKRWAEQTYDPFENGLKEEKKKKNSPCLLKQSVKSIIPLPHISGERLCARSRFQLKSHLLGS